MTRTSSWSRLAPFVSFALAALAFMALRRELDVTHLAELTDALARVPWSAIAFSVAITVANFFVIAGYDALGLASEGLTVPKGVVLRAAMIGYAISNSVGLSLISGTSVRFRFYSRAGLKPLEIGRLIVFYSVTFWAGLLFLGGTSLSAGLAAPPVPGLRDLGPLLLLPCLAYLALAWFRRTPLMFRGFEYRPPEIRVVLLQFLVSALDWSLAAAALFVLTPHATLSFFTFLPAFLIAQIAGVVSHVPGGLGVFETSLLILLRPHASAPELIPAILLFRAVYYVLPLVVAVCWLLYEEVKERHETVRGALRSISAVNRTLAPRLLAALIFISGLVLLLSGATPAESERFRWLSALLPLPLLEASHFAGSVVGMALIVLSRAVARRVYVAYRASLALLAIGAFASLLKGWDLEEALIAVVAFLCLIAARPAFDRFVDLREMRLDAGFLLAIMGAFLASLWLAFFAYRHVDYSNELWWQFAVDGHAARSLRGAVGAFVALLLVSFAYLLRPKPAKLEPLPQETLERVLPILGTCDATNANLVLMRDKEVILSPAGDAFLMFGRHADTWVCLGDPVGPETAARGLIREFRRRVDRYGGRPVFYEVKKECLHLYADEGLALSKIGEEALVDLADFSLAGGSRKDLRLWLKRVERDGAKFRVLAEPEVKERMAELREVSDQWLESKRAPEKGFSLGYFAPDYVGRFPVAILEVGPRIVAFCTVWTGSKGGEASVDLMRFRPDAPSEAMKALFVFMLLWSQERGFRSFNLGMAPLSGLFPEPYSPWFTKVAAFLYDRSENFYNFQGLRAFKAKFHPRWEPKYLAYPGTLSLPSVLADISALIAGGMSRIFR